MRRFISLLLVLLLTAALCLPARGEACFETLTLLLTADESSPIYLGSPADLEVVPNDDDLNACVLMYSEGTSQLALMGEASGDFNVIYWNDIDKLTAFSAIYYVCLNWSSLSEKLGEGCGLYIEYIGTSEDSCMIISTPEEAAEWAAVINLFLNNGTY